MTVLGKLLVLGGLYFIFSLVAVYDILNVIFFIIFLISFMRLVMKKPIQWIEYFNYHQNIKTYLQALGCVMYLSFILILPVAVITGYQAANAKYQNEEYQSFIMTHPEYVVYSGLAMVMIALIIATGIIIKRK